MAITITSNFSSQEELDAVLNSHGLVTDGSEQPEPKPVEPPAEAESGTAPVVDKPAEPPAEVKPAETKPAPAAEPAKVQEPERPVRPKPFLSKRELAERRAEQAEAALEAERAQRARERAELDALRSTQPPTETKPAGPVRPVRPTLAQFEFDQEKFDAALAKHEELLEAYYGAVSEQKADERIRQAEETRRQDAAAAADRQRLQEFENRMREGVTAIPEWDDLREAISELDEDYQATTPVMDAAIMRSPIPAQITAYLMNDAVHNGGREFHRIRGLDEFGQVMELGRLEQRLMAEAKSKGNGAPAPPTETPRAAPPPAKGKVVEAKSAEPAKPPARPQAAAKPVEPPIEPLGSRSSGAVPKLESAKTAMEYIRLRSQGVNR